MRDKSTIRLELGQIWEYTLPAGPFTWEIGGKKMVEQLPERKVRERIDRLTFVLHGKNGRSMVNIETSITELRGTIHETSRVLCDATLRAQYLFDVGAVLIYSPHGKGKK